MNGCIEREIIMLCTVSLFYAYLFAESRVGIAIFFLAD